MGSAFDDSLEVLFSGLKATCDAATEKGGVALVQAASVDIPSQISAFIARESVAQTPSRLRALSAGLGNSVLIDIATLRSTYFNGGDEGGDATTHARVLTLQALLSLQLGSMCLLPGISRLRVATRCVCDILLCFTCTKSGCHPCMRFLLSRVAGRLALVHA